MADYVIELGRIDGQVFQVSQVELGHKNELMRSELGRLYQLGQEGGGIFQTLLGFLGSGLGTLSDVVGFPLNLIGQGGSFVIKTIADLAKNVPLVGEFLSDILLAGNTLLQAGLKLPSETIAMLGNLLKSFNGLPEDKQKSLQDKSMQKLIDKAGETGQKQEMQNLLNQQKQAGSTAEVMGVVKKAAGVVAPLGGAAVTFLALQGVLGTGGALGAGAGALGVLLFGAYELGLFD